MAVLEAELAVMRNMKVVRWTESPRAVAASLAGAPAVMLVGRGGGDPEISALIVTHGAQALTERAVDALVANTEEPFELIIVDNHSDEPMRRWLSELRDGKVIFNDGNRGFGPAVNQGAALARGEYLLLLNSDAFVHPGWSKPLLEALQEDAVGAAFPCLLHPDGSLQDAGCCWPRTGRSSSTETATIRSGSATASDASSTPAPRPAC